MSPLQSNLPGPAPMHAPSASRECWGDDLLHDGVRTYKGRACSLCHHGVQCSVMRCVLEVWSALVCARGGMAGHQLRPDSPLTPRLACASTETSLTCLKLSLDPTVPQIPVYAKIKNKIKT